MHITNVETANCFKGRIDDCIYEIKQYAGNYNSKYHYERITASVGVKTSKALDELIYSNSALAGYFIMPDEISTKKLSDFLYEVLNIECDYEIYRAFVASLLQKRVNELYREIQKFQKRGSLKISFTYGEWVDKYHIKQRSDEYKKRMEMGVKIVRVK